MATPVTTHGTEDRIPAVVRDSVTGVGMLAAGANVIMQLSMLPVGHGVAKSTVDSGRVDKHPLKRARTTLSYLAVAMLGSEQDRLAMRREVNRSHRPVHSGPDDPVAYDAFDTELQLWVAACLYRGLLDVHELVWGEPDPASAEVIHRHAARLGTTLQVRPEQWPADRAAFERYWEERLGDIEMDDLTRRYLQGIARAEFLGPPFSQIFGPLAELTAVGFLPQPFRDELGLPWDERRQRLFDLVVGVAATVDRALPRPLRQFPFNAYLRDVRRRVRSGRPIV